MAGEYERHVRDFERLVQVSYREEGVEVATEVLTSC